jgi:hypothetical protein
MDIVLEHGGEDLNDEGDTWEIITDPARYEAVLAAVKAAGIPTVMSEVTMVASTYTKLEGNTANQMIRLLEAWKNATTRRMFIRTSTWTPSRWSMRRADFLAGMAGRKAARMWRPFCGIRRNQLEGREGTLRRGGSFCVLLLAGTSFRALPPPKPERRRINAGE